MHPLSEIAVCIWGEGKGSYSLGPGISIPVHISSCSQTRDVDDKYDKENDRQIAMLAEPFEAFTFSPAGAAVCQLGPFGTAAKKLKEWDLKP